MRLLLVFVICVTSVMAVTPIKSENSTPVQLALNDHKAPIGATLKMLRKNQPQVAFCGQCTKNSDCGTCRCTGPRDGSCNECKCP